MTIIECDAPLSAEEVLALKVAWHKAQTDPGAVLILPPGIRIRQVHGEMYPVVVAQPGQRQIELDDL